MPPIPEGGERLWRIFAELSAARGEGFSGPQAIGFGDIKAWCDLTGERLAPWELDGIRRLDAAAVDAWRKQQQPGGAKPPREGDHG